MILLPSVAHYLYALVPVAFSACSNTEETKKVFPDLAEVQITKRLSERFSSENVQWRLGQIKETLKGCKHVDIETRRIGFPNWVGAVEEALQIGNYRTAQLEYDLARYKFAYGQIEQSDLDVKRAKFDGVSKTFQNYLDGFACSRLSSTFGKITGHVTAFDRSDFSTGSKMRRLNHHR